MLLLTSLTALLPFISSCQKEELAPESAVATISAKSLAVEANANTNASIMPAGVVCEEWSNVSGNDVAQVPVSNPSGSKSSITTLEKASSSTPNYGRRLSAYITAPYTGNYTFAVAGDDAVDLYLSTDTDPSKKVKIAGLLSWTNFREFTKYASQKSAQIKLQAGQKYYIEVLQKQGGGDGHVSVQWTMPNNVTETPIASSRFAAYSAPAAAPASSAPTYTASGVVTLRNVHDMTISGKAIAGGNQPAISLIDCYNIRITNCKLYNSSDVGVYLHNCRNITVDYNFFTNVSTGVYVDQAVQGGIVVNNNQFLNMKGPFPRGQFVQFNNVNGSGNSISYNKGENVFGASNPEDGISLYQSNGTPSSPITVNGNWIRGGGPSASGGGIMLGDLGGSNQVAMNNILVNPGQYGMAIAGGSNNQLINNVIFGKQQYFTNVGIYVNSIGGHKVSNSKVKGNKVKFYNSNNYLNPVWLSNNADKPDGWDTDNKWGDGADASILPASIITYK
ncbi:PA14 domain-containing protein [Mucilaginibacter sp. RS28]|uniref:PA14 domain-containing protein n=1 Tax=Mucilaginibacter straminoryzae TaxID=2932774 RepID=A0A9X2BAQ7_9SPHI|nr:PA14 domain-containing protein [Mucilaginibacter straminoryzae]MCJ8211020.1 PA14 domain-containing protein [Mucilaginibacter straminoryzae]